MPSPLRGYTSHRGCGISVLCHWCPGASGSRKRQSTAVGAPAEPVITIVLPILGLGIQFLPRRMYVAVTNRRLICTRMSRLRSTLRRPALAAPLAGLRILNRLSGNYGASIRCQIPGRKPILLHAGRAGRKDFAEAVKVLARSGAFAKSDPPQPSAENLQQRRTDANDQCVSGR
jgi:hypothetical protein